jgi:hypothetical protein
MKLPPRGRRYVTWQECYDDWIASGYHPSSAKSQADQWQKNQDASKRRAEKAKET